MKKALFGLALLVALLATGCDQNKADPAIGTWKLATIQGVAASLVPGASWTIVIKSDYSFSWDFAMPPLGSSSATGTWSTKNSTDYVLTETDGETNAFTLSSDKSRLSNTTDFFGTLTLTK